MSFPISFIAFVPCPSRGFATTAVLVWICEEKHSSVMAPRRFCALYAKFCPRTQRRLAATSSPRLSEPARHADRSATEVVCRPLPLRHLPRERAHRAQSPASDTLRRLRRRLSRRGRLVDSRKK